MSQAVLSCRGVIPGIEAPSTRAFQGDADGPDLEAEAP